MGHNNQSTSIVAAKLSLSVIYFNIASISSADSKHVIDQRLFHQYNSSRSERGWIYLIAIAFHAGTKSGVNHTHIHDYPHKQRNIFPCISTFRTNIANTLGFDNCFEACKFCNSAQNT
jgi:hypothetical protein